MARLQAQEKDAVSKPQFLRAKFGGSCRCGRRISMGDMICYDRVIRQTLCVPCGKASANASMARLAELRAPSEAQLLMDRINQINSLPEQSNEHTVDELRDLKARLEQFAQQDPIVRRLLIKMRARGPVLAITAQFKGTCAGCQSPQEVGEPVAYDRNERKIYCYSCLPG